MAQQTAKHLISGHFALTAWWSLRHAGIIDAIQKHEAEAAEGLNPFVHAIRTSMAPDVLQALIGYLQQAGLVVVRNDLVSLTPEGKALYEQEDGVLGLIRAYQPVLDMSEHLLAKLKSYGPPGNIGGGPSAPGGAPGGTSTGGAGGGVYRKSEYLYEAQAKRYAAEVHPTIREIIGRQHLTHLLDVACGSGDLLIHLAMQLKSVVGVGIAADSSAVRRANTAISDSALEKRLIAVSANPMEVLNDTPRTFERIGISRQLWSELDGLLAINVLSEMAAINGPDTAAAIGQSLAATRKHFPRAFLVIAESVESPRFEKNYYAPELALLLRLSHSAPWPVERWRDVISGAKYRIVSETPLTTDGITIFLCKP
jgi:SAM-dependent methyltransferase